LLALASCVNDTDSVTGERVVTKANTNTNTVARAPIFFSSPFFSSYIFRVFISPPLSGQMSFTVVFLYRSYFSDAHNRFFRFCFDVSRVSSPPVSDLCYD
jgi:hypothetical protein